MRKAFLLILLFANPDGFSIILSVSGIFVSPKGGVQEVESVGMALVVWGSCGVMALLGGLCYAELGTTLPFGGGDYAYIQVGLCTFESSFRVLFLYGDISDVQ